jgi:endonuclease/exonuclease/phosphatase family metal-dependent hydrolase
MRLASYNIQYGFGKDGKNDLARIVGEIRGADVIALQEVERHWKRTGYADQTAEIARLLPDYYWV